MRGYCFYLFLHIHRQRLCGEDTVNARYRFNETNFLDNTIEVKSRLNSIHFLALLSLRFLLSFKSQNLLTSFHVSLVVAILHCENLCKRGYRKASVVLSIQGLIQQDEFPPSPNLWQIQMVIRFWSFFIYFHDSFVACP